MKSELNLIDACPICSSNILFDFVTRNQIPVHQNLPYKTQKSAINALRGDMIFSVCEDCGFVFNRSFEFEKLDYGEDYENSQLHSSKFNQHANDIITNLIKIDGIENSKIIEIGCGNGQFLIMLMNFLNKNNFGYGYDPSYKGDSSILNGKIIFEKNFFSSKIINFIPDIVISRHVIEHIDKPIPFLQEIRKIIGNTSRIFIETPTIDWILQNNVFWDFTYEHCSFFSLSSLVTAFNAAGLAVVTRKAIFGGQYMWMEGKIENDIEIVKNGKTTVELAKKYARSENSTIQFWLKKIQELQKTGKIALWGAGGKGTTFANLLDPENSFIDSIIDINPKKWEKFIPGSGHIIINPKKIEERNIKNIIVMNPNYTEEISKIIQNKDIVLVNT